MQFFTLPSQKLIRAEDLSLTLMSLEEWALVAVYGEESNLYLQGQLTLDINSMIKTKHYFAAHCNSKGKILSNLLLFYRDKGYAYIIRRNLLEQQVIELKKYAGFSKVTITVDDVTLLGVAGFKSRDILLNIFDVLPDIKTPVVVQSDTVILWFGLPIERFVLVTTLEKSNKLKKYMATKGAQFNNSIQWLVLDIQSGIPIIDTINSAKFLPQSMNLESLGAISFKKGCYLGQEIIARTKFRGANKFSLYCLSGQGNNLPKIGSSMEVYMNNKWRRTGTILGAVLLSDNNLWLQAILNKDLQSSTLLRVEGDINSKLNIQELPYSIK